MNRHKKIFTVIFTAALVLSVVSGCTGVTETREESSKGITVSDIVSELSKEISDIQEEVNSETESSDEETSSEIENVSDESSEVEDIIVETKENNYYKYNVHDAGEEQYVEITSYKGSDLKVQVPSDIDGLPVRTVSGNYTMTAFPGDVISIELPDTVTVIGSAAFEGSKAKTITIPDSVKEIGVSAFEQCMNLRNVKIPSGIEIIGNYAFSGCTNEETFGDKLVLPETLKELGNNAFSSIGIKEVVIPDSITKIPEHAFSTCKKLTKVTLGKNVEEIGDSAFWACENLKTVENLDKVKVIKTEAFMTCSLDNITLGEGCEIGGQTFTQNAITELTVPKGVTYPESYTGSQFSSCEKLKKVTIEAEVVANRMFHNCPNIEEVYLTDTVLKISEDAFLNTENIKIHIPESVEVIEEFYSTFDKDKVTIYGKKGSEAEKFAKDNGIKFVEE